MQIISSRWFVMERDAIWQAFAETGDPLYYLLYKNTRDEHPIENGRKKTDRAGEDPRPVD